MSVPTFLLVDDSATVRLVLRRALEAASPGCRVVEATTHEQAIAAFDADAPALTFLDMRLGPFEGGTSTLKALLAADPGARVVLATGLAREDPEVVEAVSAGAFAYLRKPVRAEDIRATLELLAREAPPATP